MPRLVSLESVGMQYIILLLTFLFLFLDDSGPEEEQSSSSGDEQTEPEADQVSNKGKFAKKLRLKLTSERFLESY